MTNPILPETTDLKSLLEKLKEVFEVGAKITDGALTDLESGKQELAIDALTMITGPVLVARFYCGKALAIYNAELSLRMNGIEDAASSIAGMDAIVAEVKKHGEGGMPAGDLIEHMCSPGVSRNQAEVTLYFLVHTWKKLDQRGDLVFLPDQAAAKDK